MAIQIDAYLQRVFSEQDFNYLEDIYELYGFISNDYLRKILASFHTQLNHWYTVINNDIKIEYDEDGNAQYKGGHFHAQDSRDYLNLISEIDKLRSRLKSTAYAFSFCSNNYDDAIRRCRRFVAKSGGSNIPEGFAPIEIEELNPIFELEDGIALPQDKQRIYTSLRQIGEGAYATVFRYTDPYYQIPVVLKRAKRDLDIKEWDRFKQEFEVLKLLHSPYIVEVYAFNESKREYTMESMDENIYNFILKNNTKLALTIRKWYIRQICQGLKYIHSKGLLHRDISLTNVFIKHYDDVDVIKIGDFGLVKTPESTLTSLQSELKGSLNDPDLINVGFGNYEMCHETYALTRLCYFILTGRTNLNQQKDGAIKQFWEKGTNTNRKERFQSVDDLLLAIQNITETNR